MEEEPPVATTSRKRRNCEDMRIHRYQCPHCEVFNHSRSVLIQHVHQIHAGQRSLKLKHQTMRIFLWRLDQMMFSNSWSSLLPQHPLEPSISPPRYPLAPSLSPVKNEEQAVLFSPGELVIAKMDGYPWWPAIIIAEGKESEILFLGRKTYQARLRCDRIKSYAHFPDYLAKQLTDKKFPKHQLVSLKEAGSWADYVLDWPRQERLEYYLESINKKKTKKEKDAKHGSKTEKNVIQSENVPQMADDFSQSFSPTSSEQQDSEDEFFGFTTEDPSLNLGRNVSD